MKLMPKGLPATFVTKRALELGVHPRDLYAWRDAGEVVELSRGVFRRADAPPASFPDLLAVCVRVPRAVVCCVSAAVVHGLTDQPMSSVQVAVPKRTKPPTITLPPTSVLRFEDATFELGLSRVEAAPGESVRIYDPARTVVDLMRLRRRFGEPLAHTALNRYLVRPEARPGLVLKYAGALNVLGPVRVALDVASAR
jgi:hypothetical protein